MRADGVATGREVIWWSAAMVMISHLESPELSLNSVAVFGSHWGSLSFCKVCGGQRTS